MPGGQPRSTNGRPPTKSRHRLSREYMQSPEVVNYLRVFDAWLAAGDSRSEMLIDELKDVMADELIGDMPREGCRKKFTADHEVIADLLQSLTVKEGGQ